MTGISKTFAGIAVSALMAAMPLTAASAQDIDAMLDRLKAEFAEQGTTVRWDSATPDGDSVTLQGVSVMVGLNSTPIGTVEMTGITEEGDGFQIGSITVPSFSHRNGDNGLEVNDISINGLRLPPEGEPQADGPMAGMMMYDQARVGSITAQAEGRDVFTMSDLHLEMTPPMNGAALTFSGGADAFSADLSGVKDPKTKAVIDALGYTNMSGTFAASGAWQPEDGKVTLSQNDITINDAGTIGMSFEIAGYTPEVAKSIREMQASMAQAADDQKAAQGMAMLGLMQQLTFRNARIYFADDSLTQKGLEFIAKQQGAKPSDIANQAKAMVPFAMMKLNDPDLSAAVSSAVSKFLDDPQNIEIVAEPAAPVPFATIMAGAMQAPFGLVKQLGVTVNANK